MLRDKKYEIIEHTADIGIRVKGDDLKKLFKNAALAMFDVIAERKPETSPSISLEDGTERSRSARNQKPETKKIIIEQKADNLEELLVDWLNELLSLSSVKDLIFSDFQIKRVDENILQALAIGEDISNYRVNIEIKAATYHQLKIEKVNSGWQVELIFDV